MSNVITVEEKALKKAVKKHLSISHLNTLEQLLKDRNALLVDLNKLNEGE